MLQEPQIHNSEISSEILFLSSSVHVKIVGDFCLCCSIFFSSSAFPDISTIRVQFPIFTFCESARQSTDLKTWSHFPLQCMIDDHWCSTRRFKITFSSMWESWPQFLHLPYFFSFKFCISDCFLKQSRKCNFEIELQPPFEMLWNSDDKI